MEYEQLRFKEALVIRYTNGKSNGSICLKTDYPDFEEKKNLFISKLIQDDFTNIETESVLYITDDELQEYIK